MNSPYNYIRNAIAVIAPGSSVFFDVPRELGFDKDEFRTVLLKFFDTVGSPVEYLSKETEFFAFHISTSRLEADVQASAMKEMKDSFLSA